MSFYVYILKCADGSYYTGHTDDLEKRVAMHEAGEVPGYTQDRRPVTLAFSDAFQTREEALAREIQIKGWSRAKKEALIAGDWERLQELSRGASSNKPGRGEPLDKLGANGDSRGIALILVSGLLVALMLFGAVLMQLARVSGAISGTVSQGTLAKLAAESGMHYAAARLVDEPRSITDREDVLTPLNARDDWEARGGEGLGVPSVALLNPSYSHGESWLDQGLPDGAGVYEANNDSLAAWIDLDGDGEFSAWSGRVRGGRNPFGNRFSLRIRSSAGLACVNSGELGAVDGDHDFDGVPNAEDSDFKEDADNNGVEDWRDPNCADNRHLVNVLNNLGAVLDVSTKATVNYWAGEPDPNQPLLGPMETSSLGIQVVSNRPRGGYGFLESLKGILGAGDYGKVEPYLTTDGEIVPIAFQVGGTVAQLSEIPFQLIDAGEIRYERHARIDFNRAPKEIIQAALRYLSAAPVEVLGSGGGGGGGSGDGGLGGGPPPEDEPPPPPPGSPPLPGGTPRVRLLKDEADAVAAALVDARPLHNWKAFLAALHAHRDAFQVDPFLLALKPGLGPQTLSKEDLILAQFDANWQYADPFLWRRNCLEVDRETVVSGPDATWPISIPKAALVTIKGQSSGGSGSSGGPGGPGSSGAAGSGVDCPNRMTAPFSLSPSPVRLFLVDSGGWAATEGGASLVSSIRGSLPGERSILLTGQQDFEPLLSSGAVDDPNPARWRYADGDAWFADGFGASPARRAGIQPFPRFPVGRTNPQGAPLVNYTIGSQSGTPLAAAGYRYPKAMGGIVLASRQWESPAALCDEAAVDLTLSIPFSEDPTAGASNDDFADNIFEPFRPLPDPPKPGGILNFPGEVQAGTGNAAVPPFVYRGLQFSPWGAQPLTVSEYSFTCSYKAPNNSVEDSKWHFGHNLFQFDDLGITAGTIVFWCPVGGRQGQVGAGGNEITKLFEIQHVDGAAKDKRYLMVRVAPGGESITLKNVSNQTATGNLADASPEAALRPTGCRCIAVTIQRVENGTQAQAYIDGVPVGAPLSLNFAGTYDGSSLMRFVFFQMGFDDFLCFKRVLSSIELRRLMLKPRFELSGNYHSPRLTFDSGRLPQGAAITGFSWDAFIPSASGGSLSFEIAGYDADGDPIDMKSFGWNGTGRQTERFAPIPGSRSVDFKVTMQTSPTIMIDDTFVLRDVPLLEECRIFYRNRDESWSSWQAR